jgi:hypothetical protein
VLAVPPQRKAFCEERCLPASVRGPVECWELARLVAARGGTGVPILNTSGWGHDALRASQRWTESMAGSIVGGVGGAWAVVAILCTFDHRDSTAGDAVDGGPA